MKLLIDTHVLLWMFGNPGKVSAKVRVLLDAPVNEVFASVVSLWEIALKCRMGKLDAEPDEIAAQFAPAGKVRLLGIEMGHLAQLRRLPVRADHRDPFDNLLIAQAIAEGMSFVSADRNAPHYGVRVVHP